MESLTLSRFNIAGAPIFGVGGFRVHQITTLCFGLSWKPCPIAALRPAQSKVETHEAKSGMEEDSSTKQLSGSKIDIKCTEVWRVCTRICARMSLFLLAVRQPAVGY